MISSEAYPYIMMVPDSPFLAHWPAASSSLGYMGGSGGGGGGGGGDGGDLPLPELALQWVAALGLKAQRVHATTAAVADPPLRLGGGSGS